MEPKMLEAKFHVDTEAGCLCRYVCSDTEYFRPHTHDYYELFMVVKGEVCHVVNSAQQVLQEGQLLFIRDFDLHTYRPVNGNYFEFINLAFTGETLRSLFEYLGEGFPAARLLEAPMPPMVMLPKREKERLFYALTEVSRNSEKSYMKMKMRALLAEVFTEYFLNFTARESQIPLWLEMTCEKMKKPQNFTVGIDRMYEIAGKSREHLSRSFKQYYHTTPTAFVTALRLDYCVNLLITSNLSVTDIGYECGFGNISWFYSAFEKKFGMTPLQYRKKFTAGQTQEAG